MIKCFNLLKTLSVYIFARKSVLRNIFIFFFILISQAFSDDWMAEVLPSQDKKEVINGIIFENFKLPIETVHKGTEFEHHIKLNIKYDKEDWSLLLDNDQLAPRSPGQYEIQVRLMNEVTPVEIVGVGPLGEVEMQKILIRTNGWKDFKKITSENPPKRTFIFSSLGLTYLHYQETNLVDISMLAATLRVSYSYLLTPPQWEFNTNAFINLLPVVKTGTSSNVRFFGFNLRFGYVFPFVKSPSRLSVLLGAYVATMLGTNSAFGYKTLLYPQVYPVYRIKNRGGHVFIAYLKYVPLNKGFGLSLTEREWAIGVGYEIPLANLHPVSIYVDFSDMALNVTSTRQIKNRNISLSVGYGF